MSDDEEPLAATLARTERRLAAERVKVAKLSDALREAAERIEAKCSLHHGENGEGPPHVIDKGEGGGFRNHPCELEDADRAAIATINAVLAEVSRG